MIVDIMWTSATVFAAMIIGFIAIAILISYFRLFFALRGKRVVTCPENHKPVGVEINAALAARTALLDDSRLRIMQCSRWPEKSDCLQECLSQVEARPDDTLMRNVLAGWYLDKDCAMCGRGIGEIRWHDAIPALRTPEGTYLDWEGITAEELTALLGKSVPVCWNCYSAESFRVSHPDLVTDRADTPLRNRLIH